MLCGLLCMEIRAGENQGVDGLFAQSSEGPRRSTHGL